MTSFKALYNLAAANRGGVGELEAYLPQPKTSEQLSTQSDDRYLSMMARCVFRAGFVWRVIDNKWPGFEEAFVGFNPMAVAYFSDEKLEELMGTSVPFIAAYINTLIFMKSELI